MIVSNACQGIFWKFTILLLGLTATYTAGAQALLLNEVEADSPDPATQFSCQYVELRGKPNSAIPANTYFVSINGASGSFGDVSFIVPLAGRTIGANGTLTIINDLKGTCPNRNFPAGTTLVMIQDFDGLGLIDGGARTFAIINSPTAPQPGGDIDTDNNRVIDPASGVTVIDGFGFTTNELFQATYAPNLFNAATQGAPGTILLPDAATRFENNTTPLSAAAWYFGELASSPAETTVYSGDPRSANFPAGGALTPGGPNVGSTSTVPGDAVLDFNGDGRTDYAVARTAGNQLVWYTAVNGTSETNVVQWGLAGDVPVPADFDGDSRDDIAVWRSGSPGAAAFYILQSSNNTFRLEIFGQTGDDPTVVGDWDGDGRSDPAVYREGPQSFFFYRGSSNNPSGNTTYLPWGTTGDRPQRGDFDGDDKRDAAVFRPSNSLWYILESSDGQVRYENWGLASDRFVPADYDGDGTTDLAVFRDGLWYVRQSSGGDAVQNWGLASDTLVPGDYNGDGRTDPAVFRGGVFYVSPFGGGSPIYQNFGLPGDYPIANTYVD